MHSGHESLQEERWDRDEIVHFDFKAQNGKPQLRTQLSVHIYLPFSSFHGRWSQR